MFFRCLIFSETPNVFFFPAPVVSGKMGKNILFLAKLYIKSLPRMSGLSTPLVQCGNTYIHQIITRISP